MKMLKHNSLVAVVLDKADTVTAGGIALARKTNVWAMHHGKKRIATVVAAPPSYTIYKNRVGQPDLPVPAPCEVKAGDRVYLTPLAGCTKFEYLGKQIVLVRVGEITCILDPEEFPPKEDLTDYIAQVAAHKEGVDLVPPCSGHALESATHE